MAIDINTLTWTVAQGASESQIVRKEGGSWTVGDVITLTVRDGVSGPVVIQKTVTTFGDSGAAVINLGRSDTVRLAPGSYVYDIQYSNAAGTVTTLIPPTPENLPAFVLTEVPPEPVIGQVTVGLNYEQLEAAPAFDGFSRVVLIVNDEGDAFVSGDTTGRTLTAQCPWGTQAMADGILQRIRGYAYHPYEATRALLDPSAELGDGVLIGDIYSGLCRREITYDAVLTSDISAPEDEEIDHEFAWQSPETRAWQRATAANRAAISIAQDMITAEVTALENLEGTVETLSSSLQQQADQIAAKVSQVGADGSSTFAWSLTASGFFINNGTVKKNGTDLLTITPNGMTVRGKIQADTGYIGGSSGFTIESRKLYSGTHSSMDSNVSGVYIGTDGISLGNNFRVTSAGNITARGINVTSGTFASIVLDGVTLRGEINNSGGRVSGGSYSGGSFSGAFAGVAALSSADSTVDGNKIATWVGDIVAGKITADYINTLYAESGTLRAAYVQAANVGTNILNVGFGSDRARASWQSASFVSATKYVYGSVTVNGITYPVVLGNYVSGASPIPVPNGYGTINYLGR